MLKGQSPNPNKRGSAMTSISTVQPEGGRPQAPPDIQPLPDITELKAGLQGEVCLRGDPGYETARTIWNAMIDRYPDVVVRCASADDVAKAVRFANDHNLGISIRGGGHNIGGSAVGQGGAMIDLSLMKSIKVD